MNENPEPLIVVVGPTAVGKTEISIRLAEKLGGEIVSADSRLIYRGMNIGTAKPAPEELRRVTHHLIDIADPDDEWSLGEYLLQTSKIISEIQARGVLPFLVGGTGQYIQAVVEGWELPDIKPDLALRQVILDWGERIGAEEVRARLELLDPEAAANIDGPNLRRMVRALEVIFRSGRKFSAQQKKSASPHRILQIGLIRSREELFRRIDLRIEKMVAAGFIEEVKDLLEAGYSPELSSLSAIGYKQIVGYLAGEYSLEEALRQIGSKTRKYVRQQANWFRIDDPKISWYDLSADPFDSILGEIQQFLS